MVFSTISSERLSDPSQPFPSPGSAFIPPPVPGPHEFALPRPRKMSKRDLLDSDAASSNSNATPTPSTNGVVDSPSQPSLPPHTPCDPPHPPSDPQLSLPTSSHTHHRLSNQSVTSLTSSRPAPPSPAVSRRASGLSRTSTRPASGMSTTPSSRPVSGAQHSRPVSGTGSRPASGTIQHTTPITTSPTTPTPTSLSHDRRPNPLSTTDLDLDPPPAEPTPTQPTASASATASPEHTPAQIQIRDYGFAPTDPRFSGQGPHAPRANRPAVLARRLAPSSESTPTSLSEGDNDDDDDEEEEGEEENDDEEGEERMNVDVVQSMWEDVDDGTNGWGGFKWGFGRAWAYGRMSGLASGIDTTPSGAVFPSRGDLDRNFGGEEEYEGMEIDEEGEQGQCDVDAEGEPPLFPGLYRALYAFEPEGTAEMKLDEDQLVRVVGRGGGVGWAVVVRDGLKDTGVHALVPESYLEPARLDGQEDG